MVKRTCPGPQPSTPSSSPQSWRASSAEAVWAIGSGVAGNGCRKPLTASPTTNEVTQAALSLGTTSSRRRCGAHVEMQPVRAAGAGRPQCGRPGSTSRAGPASSSTPQAQFGRSAAKSDEVPGFADWLACGQLHTARSDASAADRGGGGGTRAGSWSPTVVTGGPRLLFLLRSSKTTIHVSKYSTSRTSSTFSATSRPFRIGMNCAGRPLCDQQISSGRSFR